MKRVWLLAAVMAMTAAWGCRAPMPSWNPAMPFGPSRIPPPGTGAIGGAGSGSPYYQPGTQPPGGGAPTAVSPNLGTAPAPNLGTGASNAVPSLNTTSGLRDSDGDWRPAHAPVSNANGPTPPAALPSLAPPGLATPYIASAAPVGTGVAYPVQPAQYTAQDPANTPWFPQSPAQPPTNYAPPAMTADGYPQAGMPANQVIVAPPPAVAPQAYAVAPMAAYQPYVAQPSPVPAVAPAPVTAAAHDYIEISQLPNAVPATSSGLTSGMRGFRAPTPISSAPTTGGITNITQLN